MLGGVTHQRLNLLRRLGPHHTSWRGECLALPILPVLETPSVKTMRIKILCIDRDPPWIDGIS